MSLAESLYGAALRGVEAALPLLARGGGKLARGARGRLLVLEQMERWAAEHRNALRPLVWFHAPSVGEGLQALAVLEVVRRERPDLQVVYTYFSPSAEGLARRARADFAGYLPLDTRRSARCAMELLRPDLLVFSKTDAWPNLTRAAAERGVKLAMISATLPAGSSRLKPLARPLLRPAYGRLDLVAAVSEADAERFSALGVPAGRRVVMGDAHFDRVLERAAVVDRGGPLLTRLNTGRATLVAGSTWSADEERLLPALARLREVGTAPATLLVPHEPTEPHLRESERRAAELGLPLLRLSRLEALPERAWTGEELLLVDRVGVLGDLYALASVAYVGGGFGTAGLHSVLEPAAFGVPILFGPRHSNAREAGELVHAGGAAAAMDGEDLYAILSGWLSDPESAARAGARAAEVVQAGRGAAARGADLLLRLLA